MQIDNENKAQEARHEQFLRDLDEKQRRREDRIWNDIGDKINLFYSAGELTDHHQAELVRAYEQRDADTIRTLLEDTPEPIVNKGVKSTLYISLDKLE